MGLRMVHSVLDTVVGLRAESMRFKTLKCKQGITGTLTHTHGVYN